MVSPSPSWPSRLSDKDFSPPPSSSESVYTSGSVRESSPAGDMISVHQPPAVFSAPALVRVTRREYQAPTGGFDFLHFFHVEGCSNFTLRANNHVRAVVNSAQVATWGEVEVAVKVAMTSLDCKGCGLDREFSYGLYIHIHSQGMSSFAPSQLTSSGSLVCSSGVAPPAVESSHPISSSAKCFH